MQKRDITTVRGLIRALKKIDEVAPDAEVVQIPFVKGYGHIMGIELPPEHPQVKAEKVFDKLLHGPQRNRKDGS